MVRKTRGCTVSAPFLLGDIFQSKILKRGDQKKMNAWGDLKRYCHRHLPRGLTMFLVKKDFFEIKYGFVGSFFIADLGLC